MGASCLIQLIELNDCLPVSVRYGVILDIVRLKAQQSETFAKRLFLHAASELCKTISPS